MWRSNARKKLNHTIAPLQAILPGTTIIIGLSGGPDSVCLLHLLTQIRTEKNLTIIAAHLNHQWRPEAGRDATWCQQLCDSLSVPLVIATPDQLSYQPKYNGSKEEQGRLLRRYFFQSLALTHNADMIALAHHQDDQIETFFIRLLRGSSIAGLTGMKPQDGLFFRPLLEQSKTEIMQYLQDHKLSYLTDSTNESTLFLRNRIRMNLTAQLEDIDPRWTTKIPSAMKQLQKANDFIAQQADMAMKALQHATEANRLNIDGFLQLHEILQHHILLQLFIAHRVAITPSTKLFEEIIRFLQSTKSQQHQIHPTLFIHKQQRYFSFKSL